VHGNASFLELNWLSQLIGAGLSDDVSNLN
jgi:hypothetical protein